MFLLLKMMPAKKSARFFFVSLAFMLYMLQQVYAATPHSTPRVVVSIKPLHSLVAGVMQGVAEPYLIVQGSSTPHSFTFKPSAARALQNAQLVFWSDENLEVFLKKPLVSLTRQAKVIALSETKGIQRWPLRNDENWKTDSEHSHDHEEHRQHEQHMDPHVWLDPVNAKKIVAAIVQSLSQVDPGHASQYQRNGEKMTLRLDQLDRTLASDLKPVSNDPYLVFHDAYQYFEKRYHLNSVGTIVLQTDQTSSIKRLRKIQKLIKDKQVHCVFYEPEFSPKKVRAVARGSNLKIGELDPLGAALSPGPELYFSLMRNLVHSLKMCLEKGQE